MISSIGWNGQIIARTHSEPYVKRQRCQHGCGLEHARPLPKDAEKAHQLVSETVEIVREVGTHIDLPICMSEASHTQQRERALLRA